MLTAKYIIYKDKKYGFTLRLPGSWRRYCVIDQSNAAGSDEQETHFIFKFDGKLYTDILSITVYPMSLREWEKKGSLDSPLTLLGEHKGRLFTYSTPKELPSEFLDPKTGNYNYIRHGKAISMVKRMVNQDVPQIVRTFRFPK